MNTSTTFPRTNAQLFVGKALRLEDFVQGPLEARVFVNFPPFLDLKDQVLKHVPKYNNKASSNQDAGKGSHREIRMCYRANLL